MFLFLVFGRGISNVFGMFFSMISFMGGLYDIVFRGICINLFFRGSE